MSGGCHHVNHRACAALQPNDPGAAHTQPQVSSMQKKIPTPVNLRDRDPCVASLRSAANRQPIKPLATQANLPSTANHMPQSRSA